MEMEFIGCEHLREVEKTRGPDLNSYAQMVGESTMLILCENCYAATKGYVIQDMLEKAISFGIRQNISRLTMGRIDTSPLRRR